jgi:tRNA uracil 4-sulfurtransferase
MHMAAKILVRYGEIALKGKNRGQFEQQLQRNMKGALKDCSASVVRMHGRYMVSGPEDQEDLIVDRLSKVFGIVSVSPVREAALELDQIKALASEIVAGLPPGQNSFKVASRRANKDFPYASPELNSMLGAHLLQAFPQLQVDLHNPSFKLSVEIGFDKAFIYLDRIAGPGGLPGGITGRSLLLLSGGIDSPVAGWQAMKRGLTVEAVHFHSYPFTGKRSQEKTVDLCRKLAEYSGKVPLHMISVTAIQEELRRQCPPELAIILLRRMMLRLAGRISELRELHALVTGENLGQVASQTLESISVIAKASEMLILRPLVGMDKSEIIEIARKIDTYETSILPYEDCCTLFLPKNPVTRPKLAVIEKFEEKLNIEELLTGAAVSLETIIVKR